MGPVEQLMEWFSRARGWYPTRIDGQEFRCDPDHISYWQRVAKAQWEPDTFTILEKMLTPEATYCDIGAWIGPTVLFASRRCRKVYCFEPDRVAYRYLLQNLKLNKVENVLPFNMAISAEPGVLRMASPRGKRGDSMTSLLHPEGKGSAEVFGMSWQRWLQNMNNPDIHCMKMDIEGAEFTLLPTMAEYLSDRRPGLYLSLHPHLLVDEQRSRAMSDIIHVLQVYNHCYDLGGKEVELESLMEEQVINRAGSYLLLP